MVTGVLGLPDKEEVSGSSPGRPTRNASARGLVSRDDSDHGSRASTSVLHVPRRYRASRAPEWQTLAQLGAFRVQYKIDEYHTVTVRRLECCGNIHGLP